MQSKGWPSIEALETVDLSPLIVASVFLMSWLQRTGDMGMVNRLPGWPICC